jgi:hypothetical protein
VPSLTNDCIMRENRRSVKRVYSSRGVLIPAPTAGPWEPSGKVSRAGGRPLVSCKRNDLTVEPPARTGEGGSVWLEPSHKRRGAMPLLRAPDPDDVMPGRDGNVNSPCQRVGSRYDGDRPKLAALWLSPDRREVPRDHD